MLQRILKWINIIKKKKRKKRQKEIDILVKKKRPEKGKNHVSENSLRNALDYVRGVMSVCFATCEELEEKDCDTLSDESKSTIELVKNLSNNNKVRPLCPIKFLEVTTLECSCIRETLRMIKGS